MGPTIRPQMSQFVGQRVHNGRNTKRLFERVVFVQSQTDNLFFTKFWRTAYRLFDAVFFLSVLAIPVGRGF